MLEQFIEVQRHTGEPSEAKGKRIRILCPRCLKTGIITVDEEIAIKKLAQSDTGILTLQVSNGDICEHDFSVAVDRKFKMR